MRPYELEPGSANALAEKWSRICIEDLTARKHYGRRGYRDICRDLVAEFDALPIDESIRKPRVGIVGEILVKYMPMANNHLVEVLEREGAEVNVPDLLDFFNYTTYNQEYKHEYLGKPWTYAWWADHGVKALSMFRKPATEALKASKHFEPSMEIDRIAQLAKPLLSIGNQYGEGWFLAGEMAELIESGYPNIVCIQPFACLPNHVVGKGVIKQLKAKYPQSNVVAVDFDPGASEVNQLNRIKLMLSSAKKNLEKEAAQGEDA